MTLRPEPELAVLVTGVLACTVRFLERGTTAPLALAAVLVALGLTAHPAAIVSFAPLLVVAPALVRWARPRLAVAATIVTAATSLAAVLALVGSDLAERRVEAQELRTYGNAVSSWREELVRYSSLLDSRHGNAASAGVRRPDGARRPGVPGPSAAREATGARPPRGSPAGGAPPVRPHAREVVVALRRADRARRARGRLRDRALSRGGRSLARLVGETVPRRRGGRPCSGVGARGTPGLDRVSTS